MRNGVATDRGQFSRVHTPNGKMHLNGGVPRKILLRVFGTIMLGESRPVKCVISGLWAEIVDPRKTAGEHEKKTRKKKIGSKNRFIF